MIEHQILGNSHVSQRPVTTDGQLAQRPCVIRHNNEKIDVAMLVGFTRGVRAEEVYFQRIQGRDQALDNLLEEFFGEVLHDGIISVFNGDDTTPCNSRDH